MKSVLGFFASIDTHKIAHFGASLAVVGLGMKAALADSDVQSALAFIHDGGQTVALLSHIGVALLGLGSLICYLCGLDKLGTSAAASTKGASQ